MPAKSHDNFYYLGQINKATILTNLESNLLSYAEAKKYAAALAAVLEENKSASERPQLVITFEPLLIKAGGEDITKIHAGRSSQDMLAACTKMQLREALLTLMDSLNKLIADIIMTAERERMSLVPNYTNGVAAQPNTYGHYLLAFVAGFLRDSKRLQAYYSYINTSPMGATVLNGTRWPLNRQAIATRLGFDGLTYNAYDAIAIGNLETPLGAGALTAQLAIRIGSLLDDLMQQYSQPRPWILLAETNTYASSAMPQKRNPGIINDARTLASTLLGDASGTLFRSHNIPTGMQDARSDKVVQMLYNTADLLNDFDFILGSLQLNAERALEELNLDWTASQEIADILMADFGIPFRLGHHFASELVGYARAHELTPLTFPYAEAARIYSEVVDGHDNVPKIFPLTSEAFSAALNPQSIINNRKTQGGPQPSEMDIMLRSANESLEKSKAWLSSVAALLTAANYKLNADFVELLK